jgi:hypothetical protein
MHIPAHPCTVWSLLPREKVRMRGLSRTRSDRTTAPPHPASPAGRGVAHERIGFVLRIRQIRCATLHSVAPGCATLHARRARSRAYSVVKERSRRCVFLALGSAPSPTGHLCAIGRASAQRNPAGASKSSNNSADYRNCFCAIARVNAHSLKKKKGRTESGSSLRGLLDRDREAIALCPRTYATFALLSSGSGTLGSVMSRCSTLR